MIVFVDSDVIISSLLSSSAAAYTFLQETPHINLFISSFSKQELEKVCNKLDIKRGELEILIKTRLKTIEIQDSLGTVKEKYGEYVFDEDDSHIVGGAHLSHAKYLISYNIKDFKREVIKAKLGIVLFTPGMFLQYLRSRE